ncbi:MAG: peptide chain release factor N(5)-glutamine methyltransferase [Shinella sp.]|nr:peptide chain release factor N(5)-glutamine methyltransferase [Shinella sp.]
MAATLSAAVSDVRRRLAAGGIAEAAREARLLIGGLLDLDGTAFITDGSRVLTEEEASRIDDAICRRLAHEPVYRILGKRPFFGLTLTLSPETLEPRPDTEILVERLIPPAQGIVARNGTCRVLDLGTGTGAICLALIDAVSGVTGVGADISAGALETARRNADLNGMSERFKTVESDWFSAIDGQFDIITSNPPYIVSSVVDTLAEEVRRYDPRLALDGGPDGLDAYRHIAAGAGAFLKKAGFLAFEIGYDQKEAVIDILRKEGYGLNDEARDLGGNDRALIFQAEA